MTAKCVVERPSAPAPSARPTNNSKGEWPKVVRQGSTTVKIYETPCREKRRYTIAFWMNGERKREAFGEFGLAKTRTQGIAVQITNGDVDLLELKSSDRAAYLQATELLAPVGIPLEPAVAQFVEAKRVLGAASLAAAAQDYVKRQGQGLVAKSVGEVLEELIEAKSGDGLSEGYLRHLRYDLTKFRGREGDESVGVEGGSVRR